MTNTTNFSDFTESQADDPFKIEAHQQIWSDITRDLIFSTDFQINSGRDQNTLLSGFDTRDNRFEIQLAQLESAPLQGTNQFIDESLSEDQKRRMRNFDLSEQENLSILREINRHGQKPAEALFEIMAQNRVLGIGETHVSPNSQRNLGAEIMRGLKRAGATHFAIEAPAFIQPYLDRFVETGELNVSALPPALRSDDFIKILKAARDAGLKITAVDANEKYDEENGITLPANATNRHYPLNRDREMADNIADILKSPDNKVIFWVGNAHLQRQIDSAQRRSTADYLRENFSVATVRPIIASERGINYFPLAELTAPINQAVLVPTNSTRHLQEMPWTRSSIPVHGKSWDYILIHP